jgi:acetyl-CoA carboxylase biotin carboxyl carrier protein
MGLSDEDVREILRIIDESELDELRLEVPGLSLHVRKGGAPLPAEPATASPPGLSGNGATPTGAAIEAPMLGVFYRAESPNDPPFVQEGDRVEADTVVCLIEVMKLMNHIPAGVAGTVVEVLADNAALVEFGQPLFRVAPDA